ncbi:MAG: hypothetical protein HOV87_27630 [Catenulispora sp.]|nr:hypothetical protein [Catenulispora sp.]
MTAASDEDGEARLSTFKTLVTATANAIAEDLERGQRYRHPNLARSREERASRRRSHREFDERGILLEYERRQLGAQRSFVNAAASARPGILVLAEFYDRTTPFDQPHAELIATMLAASAEANGRVWLNRVEGAAIAEALERTGQDLLAAGLPRFAAAAFDQAANIHGRFKNARAEDRCEYLKSSAHRRTYPWWTPMRLMWTLSWALFGYGYKPMRLLVWIALTVAGFIAYMLHLPRDPTVTSGDAFYLAIQNFVNPMGLGDAKQVSAKWEAALEIETYIGDILRNIFFVLLIRRWFRL